MPTLILILCLCFISAPAHAAKPLPYALWADFKAHNITHDGRIIDRQNASKSHSEGQGYGLFLAQLFDEKETFALILSWSNNNLGAGLKAWSWGNNNGTWEVLDKNNATDGDILHAWALLLAGERWHNTAYTQQGFSLLNDIKELCIRSDGVILPGKAGFVKRQGIIVNPSYYIFPALYDFKRLDVSNASFWQTTIAMGATIIRQSTNHKTGLPLDWVLIRENGAISPYPTENPMFGYEAIRIPLYLLGAGKIALLGPFRQYIASIVQQGIIMGCVTDEPTTECAHEANYGHYAVMARVAIELDMQAEAAALQHLLEQKHGDNERYYDAMLEILAAVL